MLERWILETKDRHSKKAISQEVYNKWRNSAVTKRLFESLELAVIDSFQDYLSSSYTPNEMVNIIGVRDGAAQMVETVLDWAPTGLEKEDDDEDI